MTEEEEDFQCPYVIQHIEIVHWLKYESRNWGSQFTASSIEYPSQDIEIAAGFWPGAFPHFAEEIHHLKREEI